MAPEIRGYGPRSGVNPSVRHEGWAKHFPDPGGSIRAANRDSALEPGGYRSRRVRSGGKAVGVRPFTR